MPTRVYGEDALIPVNLGLECIGLDLSSGDNNFDIRRLNHPDETDAERCGQDPNKDRGDFCLTLPKELRDQIRQTLCPIPIPIDDYFEVPGGKVRLSHLEKKSAAFSWSKEHGGSIRLTIRFSSSGKEILGTYHGHINKGKLSIYLPVLIDEDGELVCGEVAASFSAKINIIGLSNYLEGPVRRKIKRKVAKAAKEAFEPEMATELVRLLVTALIDPPPPDAFFIKVSIAEDLATLSWADVVREARLVINSVSPAAAPAGKWLRLEVKLGRSGAPRPTFAFVAAPGTSFDLPMDDPNLSATLPNNESLELEIAMKSFGGPIPVPPIPSTLGRIVASFPAPSLGAGPHTDSDGLLTAGYEISVT